MMHASRHHRLPAAVALALASFSAAPALLAQAPPPSAPSGEVRAADPASEAVKSLQPFKDLSLFVVNPGVTGNLKQALESCDKILADHPQPEVEMETLVIKGTVRQRMALTAGRKEWSGEAVQIFQQVRDRFPGSAQAEGAWSRQCQILAGSDPAKGIQEIQAFLTAYEDGTPKSGNAREMLAINRYLLGKCLSRMKRWPPSKSASTFIRRPR